MNTAARAASGAQASTSGGAPWATELKQRFPCREAPIDQLVEAVVGKTAMSRPLFVSGPTATAKTAIVRALLRAMGLRHAYINCIEVTSPRPLLTSVLHQLRGGKRLREDGWDASLKCEGIADFLLQLPAVAAPPRGKPAGPAAASACAWVVIDHAERLAGSELLTALSRAVTRSAGRLGLILITSSPEGMGLFPWGWGANIVSPATPIPFPGYKPGELSQIMEARQRRRRGGREDPVFRQFLGLFVPAFCRASNNLLDLRAAVDRLYPLYHAPLREGKALQANQLYARIRSQVGEMIKGLEFHSSSAGNAAGAVAAAAGGKEEGAGAGAAAGGGVRASSKGLAFELPYVSKFLLLAAYVASRNKPATDRAVFDPTYGKRSRKDHQAMDRQAEAAVEAKLRGPHAFPLERLLQIFFCLYSRHADAEDDKEADAAGAAARRYSEMMQGEVLMQVTGLVALRQLSHSSGDILEGQMYRCNLTEAAAHDIAKNLRVDLGDYLKLA